MYDTKYSNNLHYAQIKSTLDPSPNNFKEGTYH